MKKYLALILGVLFVLSFAASAFAVMAEIPSETTAVVATGGTQITLGGEIRVRGWYKGNVGDVTDTRIDKYYIATEDGDIYLPGFDTTSTSTTKYLPTAATTDTDVFKHKLTPIIKYGHPFPYLDNIVDHVHYSHCLSSDTSSDAATTYYDERVRLWVDAKITPNVEGYVMLETNGGATPAQSDVYTWGNFNAKPNSMNINQAWIKYSGSGLLGFNSGFMIGHMPLALGEKQFFDHTKFGDDAILVFMAPTKELNIALIDIKFSGDGGANLNVPMLGLVNVPGGLANSYSDDLDGYVALMTYKVDDKNTVGVNYTYLHQGALDFSHQDLGFHANGNIGGLGYKGEVDFQFGSVGAMDADFKGYAVMLGLNYNVNPVNLRASFGLGTGMDDSNDIKEFTPYLGNDQHYTLVYEYQVASAAYTGGINTGLANTTYYNLGLDYNAAKDLSFGLDGYILRATKTMSGISKDVGWEVDGKMNYTIAKNLTYQIDAGYFSAGKFYEDNYCIDAKPVTVLRHALTLSF